MKLAFFEGDTLLGVGVTNTARNAHYMCPRCGTIWGREIVLDPERADHENYHQSFSIHCPEHAIYVKWATLPMFSQMHEPPWLVRRVPREVLARDFLFMEELTQREES
jgi:hypothetical protein